MKKTILVILICLAQFPAFATVYYVSQPTGNDNNNGTSTATPFKTIQKAANLVLPGDVVNVMNGNYTNTCPQCLVVDITRAGTPSAWITFQNYAGHAPVLRFNGWVGFKLGGGAAYIRITGFEVIGNNANITLNDALNQPGSCNNPNGQSNPIYNGNGIAADGRNETNRPHHLRFDNNSVHDCGGPGISAIQSDYITVEDNLIYNNSWYTIYGTSGISMWQLWNFDGTTTTHNIIRRNRCFGNRLYVPWIGQCAITDGNGIIIDDSRNTQNGSTLGVYTAHTRIENNIVWNNGGSGIHTYESDHVTIIHNTAFQNSQSPETTGGEIFANSSGDIKILNNILWAADGNVINTNYSNTNLTYDYNLHWGGTTAAIVGTHTVTANPNLILPELSLSANFRLMSGSPAINSGDNANSAPTDYDGAARPYGSIVDIGAFEQSTPLPVVYLEGLQSRATTQHIELFWSTASEFNTDYFEIYRSSDGRSFEKIGQVAAQGVQNKTHAYHFLDDYPTPGVNYYQLNQVDIDARSHRSNIATVSWQPTIFSVAPNPVSGIFSIKGDASWEYAVLKNTLGQTIRTFQFSNDTSLDGCASGVYALEIYTSKNTNPQVLRIIKQ